MKNPGPEPPGDAHPPQAGPASWDLLLGLGAVKLALLFLVGNGYGFYGDEFYYLACGRRPAWGYVDQPPLVPLLAHLSELVFGRAALTPLGLHGFSALAGATTVGLAGLVARELGGGRYAQGLAALAVLAMPLFLASGEVFQTVVFDQLLWALACWLVLRTLRTGQGRGWLLVGLAAGIGLETKDTMGLFGLGLAAALLLTDAGRRHLRTPWPWLGGGLALALLLPNLLWQHAHGWPTLEFIHNNNADVREDWTLPGFLGWQLLFVGPGVAPLLVLGVWRAVRRPDAGARVIAWIAAAALAVLLALRGKPYYLGPVYPALAALGGVALESCTARWQERRPSTRRWLRPALVAGTVLCALPLVPAALPLVPRARLAGSWEARFNPYFADEIGWPELAAQVGTIFRQLPPGERAAAIVLTANYAEAAAIELLGPATGGGMPVVSPHNNYWLWGPGAREPQTVIVVGVQRREWLEKRFGQVAQVAIIDNPVHIANYEWRHRIYLCRQPKQSLRAAWPGLKVFE